MEILCSDIEKIIKKNFPERKIISIDDRGNLIRHCFLVLMDNDEQIVLKIKTHPEYGELKHECNVVKMFKSQGITAPQILAIDESKSIIPYSYIIQEWIGGLKLGDVIKNATHFEQHEIYKEIGVFYRKIHEVKNSKSGLWDEDTPYKLKYDVLPNDYMFNAEIINGSGKKALTENLISETLYNRVIELWRKNMEYLKKHKSTMIHFSPFLWTIYMEKINNCWKIAKLTSLGDVMWWDQAYDLAVLKYPPFGDYDELKWNAFLAGYDLKCDEKRINLYALMVRLCATMGTYTEPSNYKKKDWIYQCSNDLEKFIEIIESNDS